MKKRELLDEIVTVYRRHGWHLRSALLCPRTRAEMDDTCEVLRQIPINDAEFDALWFARPSHAGREAWELRLLAEQPYALFRAFEADESEDDREAARREMENRMRDHAKQS